MVKETSSGLWSPIDATPALTNGILNKFCEQYMFVYSVDYLQIVVMFCVLVNILK